MAPSLTTALYPVSAFSAGCPPGVDKEGNRVTYPRAIRDLETDEDIWTATVDQLAWGAFASPDGTEYLIAEFDCTKSDPSAAMDRVWSIVSVDDPTPRVVNDPLDVLQGWYGDAMATGVCNDTVILPAIDAFADVVSVNQHGLETSCEGEPVELVIGGEPIDSHEDFLVLGFLE